MQIDETRDDPPVYAFGWWPEIFGAVLTVSITAFLMAWARGWSV